jgi:hypothetical protein
MTTTGIRRLIASRPPHSRSPRRPAASAQRLTTVAIAAYTSNGALALDVEGGSTQVGAKVIQWYGSFSANQRWNFVTRPDGTQAIVSRPTASPARRYIANVVCNGRPDGETEGAMTTRQSLSPARPPRHVRTR